LLFSVVALLVMLACVLASARRLVFAVAPTALDPELMWKELRGEEGRAKLPIIAERVKTLEAAEWERALFEALASPKDVRALLVNEQLTELDWRTQRWARVPRVCASISTSAGFLLAALAMRQALGDPAAFAEETRSAAVGAALIAAINVAAIGLAGTAFCIAAQQAAKRYSRVRLEATDRLVERLEALVSP
jgi:hypothetical protein